MHWASKRSDIDKRNKSELFPRQPSLRQAELPDNIPIPITFEGEKTSCLSASFWRARISFSSQILYQTLLA